ncbi:hypothetical protein TYRP_007537 [Tyrophagus putrescentiae]|nr:hypothetical protein TYRP_007537 [Tyrophagus putrescentiae]
MAPAPTRVLDSPPLDGALRLLVLFRVFVSSVRQFSASPTAESSAHIGVRPSDKVSDFVSFSLFPFFKSSFD